MPANMLQANPSFYTKLPEKNFLYLQIYMKSSLFVKTTASPITTIRRVVYPLVNILYYYMETLKSC